MQNISFHSRSATTAIVAALALGSTSLAAQTVTPSADPPIVQPETPASAAPVVVVPDASAAPAETQSPAAATSTPVLVSPVAVPQPATAVETPPVQSDTAPRPAAEAAATERQSPPQAETTTAAPAPRETAAQIADSGTSAPVAQEEAAFIPPAPVAAPMAAVPPAVAAEPADPAGQTANQVALLTGVFFILLLLGLGIFTYSYWRRRSTAAAVPTVERPMVAQQQEADRTTLTLEMAAAIADEHPDAPREPATRTDNVAPIRKPAPQTAADESVPVTLPTTIPESFEERDALIQQMVAAKPDKANPFRSRKARQRRARLILQSLARKIDGREPWIDLSQYASDWAPAGRRRNSFA